MDLAVFKQRIDATIDQLKAGKRRPGVDEILVPGERSARTAAANRAHGIPLTDETRAELQVWCIQLCIPYDLHEVPGS